MNQRNLVYIVIAVVLILVVGGLWLWMRTPDDQDINIDTNTQSAEVTTVRGVVTDFGSKLKNVSLLAPKADLTASMDQHYASYVTPELLASWKADTAKAPGRKTSSPWPERIDISSTEKNNNVYTVKGDIVEITSEQIGTNNSSSKTPITVTVEKRDDKWLITSFVASQTQGQTTFNKQGVITRNTPGLKANVWYLTYEEPGSPGLRKELDTSAISLTNMYLYNGQTASVQGSVSGDVVKVSKLQIINASKADLIWVATPLPNQVIQSGFTIAGRARGSWYFEASFPVKLLDGNGNVIAQKPAQAQGEWMTNEYVSFSLTMTFTKPSTATGTLVLEKDNPSGLPENANEVRIPVRFQ